MFPYTVLLLPLWLSSVVSTTHYYKLSVGYMTGAPDGVKRTMLGINGMSPGPAIVLNAGDRIIATVKNIDIVGGTAMHWHGIHHVLSNNMDGVIAVTQRTIPVNESFVYDFLVDGAGSFWYHAHAKNQYMAGIRGALIVLDPTQTMYTNRFLMLADWYHTSEEILQAVDYLVPSSNGTEPVPDSATIHGIGQNVSCIANNNCRYTTTTGTAFTAGCGKYDTYAKVLAAQASLAAGLTTVPDSAKITRLHTINGAGFAQFNFSIDGHALWVLSLDGQAVVPQKVSSLMLNVGQRVDVAVCRIDPSDSSPKWMRSSMNQNVFGYNSNSTGALGIFSYSSYSAYSKPVDAITASSASYSVTVTNANATTPLPAGMNYVNFFQSSETDYFGFQGGGGDAGFHADTAALPGLYPPPNATRTIPLRIDFYQNNDSVNVGHFNGISMVMNDAQTPLLDQIEMGMSTDMMGMNIINFNDTEVIQLVIDNYDTGEHPIHIHGRRLYVLFRGDEGSGPFNNLTMALNIVDPILRDTITVAPNSTIVLRFAGHNPGLWMMHCHINWHMAAGLMMLFHEHVTPLATTTTAVTAPVHNRSSIYVAIGVSVGVGVGAIVLVLATLCVIRCRKMKKDAKKNEIKDEI